MLWKMTNILKEPLDPDWNLLLSTTVGSPIHEKRKMGFILAREALLFCLEQLGESLSIKELTLLNFSTLKMCPQYTLSLSHSADWGAAVVADKKKYRSVGIDIELKTRNMSPAIKEKISHPKDINLKEIELWCAKEATFKALMNTGEFFNHQNFSDILLEEGTWIHIPSKIEGVYEVKTIDQNVLALAWINA